jgi:hypothetical protein
MTYNSRKEAIAACLTGAPDVDERDEGECEHDEHQQGSSNIYICSKCNKQFELIQPADCDDSYYVELPPS